MGYTVGTQQEHTMLTYLQAFIGICLILAPFILTKPAAKDTDKVELLFDRRQGSR